MELVRRVTGHSTVNVVLKHYFRPDREVFRQALESALPQMITGGPQALLKPKTISPKESLLLLAEKSNKIDKETLISELNTLTKQLTT